MKAKYTKPQLKELATHLLEAQKRDPEKYLHMLLAISMIANVSVDVVEHRIEKYAKY
jgi:hypothetical protein